MKEINAIDIIEPCARVCVNKDGMKVPGQVFKSELLEQRSPHL